MDEIFSALYQSQQGARYGLDQEGRVNYSYLAVVTTNEDPENRRRIKVSDPAVPSLESPWIRRKLSHPGFDPPLPAIGSTVEVTSIDGDLNNGWYSQCVNNTNPPLPKSNPIDDLYSAVAGEQVERTDGNRIVNVGKSLMLKTDSGASIELTESGDVVISSSGGQSITLSSNTVLSPTVLIGSKEVVVVGSKDTAQDTNNQSGQG